MNWANRITLSRLLLTVLFVIALNSSWPYGRTTALVIAPNGQRQRTGSSSGKSG